MAKEIKAKEGTKEIPQGPNKGLDPERFVNGREAIVCVECGCTFFGTNIDEDYLCYDCLKEIHYAG